MTGWIKRCNEKRSLHRSGESCVPHESEDWDSVLLKEGLPTQCGYMDCLGEYPALHYPSSIWWHDDNMRRHTEAEASVLFGKSRNPFSPSTPAPLSKGGDLYGPMYLDEVRWQSNQGEETDGRRRRRQNPWQAWAANYHLHSMTCDSHHKRYITGHK